MFTYYHAAPLPARKDIQRVGLLLSEAIDSDEEGREPAVYAWGDFAAAKRCAGEFERTSETPHDVWEISSDTKWKEDSSTCGFQSSADVPPARLKLVHKGGSDWSEKWRG